MVGASFPNTGYCCASVPQNDARSDTRTNLDVHVRDTLCPGPSRIQVHIIGQRYLGRQPKRRAWDSLGTTYGDGQTKRDVLSRMHAPLEMSITMSQGLVPNACRIEKRPQDSNRFGDPRG